MAPLLDVPPPFCSAISRHRLYYDRKNQPQPTHLPATMYLLRHRSARHIADWGGGEGRGTEEDPGKFPFRYVRNHIRADAQNPRPTPWRSFASNSMTCRLKCAISTIMARPPPSLPSVTAVGRGAPHGPGRTACEWCTHVVGGWVCDGADGVVCSSNSSAGWPIGVCLCVNGDKLIHSLCSVPISSSRSSVTLLASPRLLRASIVRCNWRHSKRRFSRRPLQTAMPRYRQQYLVLYRSRPAIGSIHSVMHL